MSNITLKLIEAYAEVNEKKKMDPVGQADADIDNDGDVDKSDKYLHNRRKAVKKAMKDDEMNEAYESVCKEMKKMHDEGYGKKAIMAKYKHMEMATVEKLYAQTCSTKEEVEENSKASLAKKLAKASAPSEKGKKAVTLKKAPWEKNEANNDEEVVMNPKKDKDKKAEADTMANEEAVNELSKATLGSYAKKAVSDIDHQKKKAAKYDNAASRSNNDKTAFKNINKASRADQRADNRKKGIVKAVDKLTREEVELDEGLKKHMSPYDAKEFLKKHNAHNKDFHSLPASSASAMHDKAKELKYKKSRSAPGSTGRMFHAALQRHADSYKGTSESVLPPVYARIMEERAKHMKGATPPEGMMDNSKSSKGAMDMVNQPKEINNDDEKGHEDASKAGRVGPSAKARPADNMKGDKKVIPSATPMKGK